MSTNTQIPRTDTLIANITECIAGYAGNEALQSPSYETGLLGYSLYYLYLGKYKNEPACIARAEAYVEKALASLDLKNFRKLYPTDSIDAHLSHIGRFILFCNRHKLLNLESEQYLQQLDGILFALMKSKIAIHDFDSGCGAMAAGYYFLSRMANGSDQQEKLACLVNGLQNCAVKDESGDYYWPWPALRNRVYLGISHGSALIISFLSEAVKFGVEKELCLHIMDKAVNFLVKQYRRSEYKGLFPNWVGDKVEPMQFSLCYGDAGTGYALYRAAVTLSSARVNEFAGIVLEDCLLRTKEDNLTFDASILYGASGLALAFDEIAYVSGDSRFSKRAAYWYEAISRYAIHDERYAGFRSRHQGDSVLWNVSYGWGIIGIGISLMYFGNRTLPSIAELTYLA